MTCTKAQCTQQVSCYRNYEITNSKINTFCVKFRNSIIGFLFQMREKTCGVLNECLFSSNNLKEELTTVSRVVLKAWFADMVLTVSVNHHYYRTNRIPM